MHQKLQTRIVKAAKHIVDLREKYKAPLRTCAYIAALQRINEAIVAKGASAVFNKK